MLVNLRNKILPILAEKGWTVELLAEKCEVTKNGMHGIINNGDTKASTLDKIATALGIHAGEFFTLTQYPDENQLSGAIVEEPQHAYGRSYDPESTRILYLVDKLIKVESENHQLHLKLLDYENK